MKTPLRTTVSLLICIVFVASITGCVRRKAVKKKTQQAINKLEDGMTKKEVISIMKQRKLNQQKTSGDRDGRPSTGQSGRSTMPLGPVKTKKFTDFKENTYEKVYFNKAPKKNDPESYEKL
ncbi:MAG: hypothetical protein ABEJ65_12710, partial [bacterium]